MLVDDDEELRVIIGNYLQGQGFQVLPISTAGEARSALDHADPDLILLDLTLGDDDGLSLCREWRLRTDCPIIMLTARSTVQDRIDGIDLGADDYVCKPFEPRELVSRIRAILRRSRAPEQCRPSTLGTSQAARPAVLSFLGWRLHVAKRELRAADGALVPLSDAEFDVLLILVERPQRVLSRLEIFDLLHGRAPDPEDRSLDLRISRLRRKIEDDPKQPQLIKTVRAGGFLFTETVTAE
ncbi:MAG: response regulator [Alphaproteobacteria bacterium]